MLINLGLGRRLGSLDALVLPDLFHRGLNGIDAGIPCVNLGKKSIPTLQLAASLINLRIRLLRTLTSLSGKNKSVVWRTYSSWIYVAGLRKGSGGFSFILAT